MNEDDKQNVDASSAAFKGGIQAGLNSAEDTKNWKAGNELGMELKEELPVELLLEKKPIPDDSIPLFMRDSREGKKGNAQDEKDEMEE